MTCGNPDRSALIYNTYELEILDQAKRQRKCKMDDQIKKFEVGNIIHYTGKVYDCNNFYAKIDNITSKGMDITLLDMKVIDNNALFFNTKKRFTGLTRRPFYVLNE